MKFIALTKHPYCFFLGLCISMFSKGKRARGIWGHEMSLSKKVLCSAVAVAALMAGQAAHAGTVNATLTAHYFEIFDHTDPDVNLYNTPIVALGSSLGPNGMPVASGGVNDINSGTGELTWWSPTLNSNVYATGTGTISLPYASNMYPPNSTGGDDYTGFETAYFTGSFSLGPPGTVSFQLGSDDDSFIYVDGTLFGQNPGVHGVSNVNFTSPTLGAGGHQIEVFFADRENSGAYLSLNLLSDDVVITPGVPEPSTWALLIGGLGLTGATLRRRRAIITA